MPRLSTKLLKHEKFQFIFISNSVYTKTHILCSINVKGPVIKYGSEGGGKDLAGSAKLLGGKCCASKIFQVISMGHEGICLQYLTIVLKTFSIIFAALLIVGIVLNVNSNTMVSSSSSLLF